MNYLSFYLFGKEFQPSFLKDDFAEYGIVG